MSSIDVDDLKLILKDVPNEYEVVMQISTKYDVKAGTSYAYINGVHIDDARREVLLTN